MLTKEQIEIKDLSICMDKILEFLRQFKFATDTENMMCNWYNTKQYTLYHFQKYINGRIEINKKLLICNQKKNAKSRSNYRPIKL